MKEESYMNEIDKKEIIVKLEKMEDKELLKFCFDVPIYIDLASDDSEQLKKFFQELLENIVNKDITLTLTKQDGSDLFYDVAKKYIDHLESEINAICTQKLNRLEISEEDTSKEALIEETKELSED